MDKSLPQLSSLYTIEDTHYYHLRRNSIDYKISGRNLKSIFQPYRQVVGLLSQQTPGYITGGTLSFGATYKLISYNTADNFSNMELLTGTFTTTGSTFRAITSIPISYVSGSTLYYDGAPYFSSRDFNGFANPFVNTFDSAPTFEYLQPGLYKMTFVNDNTKLFLKISNYNDYDNYSGNTGQEKPIFTKWNNLSGNTLYIYNAYYDVGLSPKNRIVDNLLRNTPFKLLAYD